MTDAPRPLILLVEDEEPIRRFVSATLTARGYDTLTAATAREAGELAGSRLPDVVLLDLGLPDADGLDVLATIRSWSAVPIIVLTARGMERDKVAALDRGADDYITKPFGIHELLARVRVALRHADQAKGTPPEPVVTIGDVVIDLARHVVTRNGARVHLTPIEYRLLALLARNAGKVCTHRQVLEQVWGPAFVEQPHYLRIYMRQLRRKLEATPDRPRWLLTETGIGYRLAVE
jgi:two-component system KDP operon response regulator KdpE